MNFLDSSPAAREGTPDLLKGMAILMMIQVHIMELFAQQQIYDGLMGQISLFLGGPPAAPVFMAVMGYFLARTKKSTGQMIYRGFKLLLWGLLLNLGLNAHLLINIFFGDMRLNPLEYIFGVDILFLAGFSIIAVALLRLLFQNNFLPYLVLAFVVAALTPYLSILSVTDSALKYLQAFFWGDFRWSYFPLFPWLSYPLLGYAFRIFHSNYLNGEIPMRWKLTVVVLLGIGFALTTAYAADISAALEVYYHHGLPFFTWIVLFLAFWSAIFSLLENELGDTTPFRYVKWLGENVTAFYVFQWLIIGNIATAIYKTQTLAEILVWFPAVLALSSLLIFLWIKIKAEYAERQAISY